MPGILNICVFLKEHHNTNIVSNKHDEHNPDIHTGEWCCHQFYNLVLRIGPVSVAQLCYFTVCNVGCRNVYYMH
jgi:hypothetical protein